MKNTDQIRENIDAARRYEPVKAADIEQLRDVLLAAGPTMCADCEGLCSIAAGTQAELGNLTRFLTYHEHHGYRAVARRQYARLLPKHVTGRTLTCKQPNAPAPAGSTSQDSCPKWTGILPEINRPDGPGFVPCVGVIRSTSRRTRRPGPRPTPEDGTVWSIRPFSSGLASPEGATRWSVASTTQATDVSATQRCANTRDVPLLGQGSRGPTPVGKRSCENIISDCTRMRSHGAGEQPLGCPTTPAESDAENQHLPRRRLRHTWPCEQATGKPGWEAAGRTCRGPGPVATVRPPRPPLQGQSR